MLTLAVGCSSRTYPVKGTVVFEDDRPATSLAGGFVHFQSVEEETVSAQGYIDEHACFVLTTFKKNDGAVPGKHRIIVTPPPFTISESGIPLRQTFLDPRYQRYETSNLEETVEPTSNDITLKLQKYRQ
jgi:hypothetical protein